MKTKIIIGQEQIQDKRWQTKTPTMTEEELAQQWDESEISGYGLNMTDTSLIPAEKMVFIREEWIKATTKGIPFYIVDPEGKIWMISVDNAGMGITVHEVITTYEPQAPSVDLKGPDAWESLEEIFPRYTVVPPEAFGAATAQAHVASDKNVTWFIVVQNIIKQHQKYFLDK
jgi:hypothetical protein